MQRQSYFSKATCGEDRRICFPVEPHCQWGNKDGQQRYSHRRFKVSTDYILGFSTLSVRKSYDISELGLSEGAVRGLVAGTVDVQILNRLLEHRNFPKLMDLIRIYFQDTAAKGIMARNQLIELETASLSDLMKEHPEHRAEAKQDLQLLNAQKMGEHEAEIEKIKNVFLAILRDIKKDMDNREQPGEAVTTAMFHERPPAGAAFYGRCNCYDCRTDWEVSSDGRGNGGTVPAVGKEDDGAGRKIIAEKYM